MSNNATLDGRSTRILSLAISLGALALFFSQPALCALRDLDSGGLREISAPAPSSCEDAGDFVVTGHSLGDLAVVDSVIEAYMRAQGIPNASVAIASRRGHMVLARGYTHCDAFPTGEEKLVTQPNTQFRIASVSKPLTAIATMQLIDDGRLGFSTPMLDHVEGVSETSRGPADPALYDVTVDHLLKHKGGWDTDLCTECVDFTDPDGLDAPLSDRTIAEELGLSLPISQDDMIRFMNDCDLNHTPGDTVAYSNYGYLLLGKIIEDVTGQPYTTTMIQNVLNLVDACDTVLAATAEEDRRENEVHYYPNPLGSSSSDSACASSGIPNPVVRSVVDPEEPCVYYPYGRINMDNIAAPGGWLSTVIDLVKIGRDLTGWRMAQGENVLLSSDKVNKMFTGEATGSSLDYARGWYISRYLNNDRSHTGTIPGHRAFIYIFSPNRSDNHNNAKLNDVVVTMLFNREPAPPSSGIYSFDAMATDLVGASGVLNSLSLGEWGVEEDDLLAHEDFAESCSGVAIP